MKRTIKIKRLMVMEKRGKNIMKKKEGRGREQYQLLITLAVFGLLFAIVGVLHNVDYNIQKTKKMQQNVAKEIIRFHVIANSDSEADQALKLKVKDKVVSTMQTELKEAKSLEEARKIIEGDLTKIKKIAEDTIQEEGYPYQVSTCLGTRDFPVKVYGDMVFPAGKYEALQVKIGESVGKNWWCVMFPTLCFVDGTYSVVPEEEKEKLETVLDEEDYQDLLLQKNDKVEVKFKLVEWFRRIQE